MSREATAESNHGSGDRGPATGERDGARGTGHSPLTPQSSAEALDELAALAVAAAEPIRFALAATEVERRATYHLRCHVVVSRGWAPSSAFPDGLERDDFDDVARHVIGLDGDLLAATARIVLPSPGQTLPTEAAFDLDPDLAAGLANVDRIAIAPGYSDTRHRVMIGLLGAVWREVRAAGCDVWLGTEDAAMLRLYRLMGFEPEIVGLARRYWSEERFPIRFDATRVDFALLERRLRR